MHITFYVATLLTITASLGPAPAAAQMTLDYESADRLSSFGFVNPPVGIAECSSTSPISIRLGGLDQTAQVIDIWAGPGTTDCTSPEARNPLTGACRPVTVAADTWASTAWQKDLDLLLSELVDCAGPSTRTTLWFLYAQSLGSREEVTLAAALPIMYDALRPDPPIAVSDALGETAAVTTWLHSNAVDLRRYEVYGDPESVSGSCDEALAATTLLAGEPLSATDYRWLAESRGRDAAIDPRDLWLSFGESAAFVVVATDWAGNQSMSSELACVSSAETMGFDELAGGEAEGCSAVGGPGLPESGPVSAAGLTLLFVVGLGFRCRYWRLRR